MAVYLLVVFVCLLAFWYHQNKYIVLSSFFVVFFISLFRGDNIGIDTLGYMMVRTYMDTDYSSVTLDSNTKIFEITTNFIYYLIANKWLTPRAIVIFFSVTTFAFIYLTSRRYKISLGYLLFFFTLGGLYLHSFNLSRQVTSISIVLYSLYYIFESKKKSLLFFLFVAFAASIHGSSLYLSVLYVFRWLKIAPRTAIWAVLLISPFFLFDIISPLNLLIKYAPYFFVEHYYDDFISREVSFLGYIASIICLSIQVFLLYNHSNSKFLVLYITAIIITCMTGHLPTIIMRIFLLFDFVVCLFYSDYLNTCDAKTRMPIKIILSLYFTYTFISAVIRTPSIYPYNFCF